MNALLSIVLRFSSLRRKLIFYVKARHFCELGYSIPIGNDYWANLSESDSYDSFSEVFVQQEYSEFLPTEPIGKMLDLGAHYGYFSLWVQSKWPDHEIQTLMVEPSSNCINSLQYLSSQKRLNGSFNYIKGVIGNSNGKTIEFYERPFMAGSCFLSNEQIPSTNVEIVTEQRLIDLMPPPYDLIKCDIEGSEWDFLINYPIVLQNTKHLILEWHSWHTGGTDLKGITEKLIDIGFIITKQSKPTPALGNEGKVGLLTAINRNFSS